MEVHMEYYQDFYDEYERQKDMNDNFQGGNSFLMGEGSENSSFIESSTALSSTVVTNS